MQAGARPAGDALRNAIGGSARLAVVLEPEGEEDKEVVDGDGLHAAIDAPDETGDPFLTELVARHPDIRPAMRAAVEMSKEWRTDKYLRNLEALLIVADERASLVLSGNGDVIEPDDGLVAIGSGGPFALSAARALMRHTQLDARAIAEESLRIAGSVCIYTNENVVVEEL